MSRKFVYICSNPKCKTSVSLVPFEKDLGCPDCNEVLMVVCPHCSMPFDKEGQTFCIYCKKRIKELPQSDSQ